MPAIITKAATKVYVSELFLLLGLDAVGGSEGMCHAHSRSIASNAAPEWSFTRNRTAAQDQKVPNRHRQNDSSHDVIRVVRYSRSGRSGRPTMRLLPAITAKMSGATIAEISACTASVGIASSM